MNGGVFRNQLARVVSWSTPRFGAICTLVFIAALAAYALSRTRHHEPDTVPVRQANAQEFKQIQRDANGDLARLQGENGRLAKLLAIAEGKTIRKPDTIIKYDTVISPPDTVTLFASIDGSGHADVTRGVKDSTGNYKPETAKQINVSDCDDGLALAASGIVCNRALLGHVSLIARASVSREVVNPLLRYDFAAGIHWQHTFRSTSSADITFDTQFRLTASATFGLRIF